MNLYLIKTGEEAWYCVAGSIMIAHTKMARRLNGYITSVKLVSAQVVVVTDERGEPDEKAGS
jgi:hypothetical protein